MPKHGWKWRTEQFRNLSKTELEAGVLHRLPPAWIMNAADKVRQDATHWAHGGNRSKELRAALRKGRPLELAELREWKRRQVTPKVARWIYETLLPDPHLDKDEEFKHLQLALLFVIASYRVEPPWKNSFFWREIEKQKDIPYGMWVVEAMSGMVGGLEDVPRFIALYEDPAACQEVRGEALFGLGYLARMNDPRWNEATHDVCLKALNDKEIPYARAGACCLAAWTLRFEDEVSALREDQTLAIPAFGQTVAFYANDYYEDYEMLRQ